MYREIRKKLVILNNRKPFKPEVTAFLGDMLLVDWIYMNLKLEGHGLSRNQVESVVKGEILMNAPVEAYLLVKKLEELWDYMKSCSGQGLELSPRRIMEMYGILTDNQGGGLRRTMPVIPQLDYVPVQIYDIEELMEGMLGELNKEHFDQVRAGVMAKLEFVRIYPFDQYNEILARATMYYFFMLQGIPCGCIRMDERDYNEAVCQWLGKREKAEEPLYHQICLSIINVLNIGIQLTDFKR